ncbi:MAG: PilZ domain-containing protein [Nitrospiraceae bacterium]|nr:MAG: PilZ domain-containing protein [Nitrospiraceae bacterium]
MERRSGRRLTARLDARFFFGSLLYSGTILNISEKGMFITARRSFPSNTVFVVIFRIDGEILKVIARVRRNAPLGGDVEGMGLELVSPSRRYAEYAGRLMAQQ